MAEVLNPLARLPIQPPLCFSPLEGGRCRGGAGVKNFCRPLNTKNQTTSPCRMGRNLAQLPGANMTRSKQLTTMLFPLTISLFLTALLVAPASAVKTWRESKIGGGWQIWISAADFDRGAGLKRGKEVPKLIKGAPQPFLGEIFSLPLRGMGLRNMTLRVPSRGRSERRLFSPVSWIFGVAVSRGLSTA